MEDGEILDDGMGGPSGGIGESNGSSTSTIWPLPCSLTSLLSMNCRARAEGLARCVQSRISYTGYREDMMPLNSLHCTHGLNVRSASVDESFEKYNVIQKPIHVVTSEPTMHIMFSMPQKSLEDDSDLHYDFGLTSPEDSNGVSLDASEHNEQSTSECRKPISNKNVEKWSEDQAECSEKPESGCVTSVTSPIMFRDVMLVSSSSSPPKQMSPSNDADLRAVREILSFTSLSGINGMSQSMAEISGVDSGLYTDGDLTNDSVEFLLTCNGDESEDDTWQTCSELNGMSTRPSNIDFNAKKYESISPPEGFRNMSWDDKDVIALVKNMNKQRRRSFDMEIKLYMQPAFRRGTPPGYRLNDASDIDWRKQLMAFKTQTNTSKTKSHLTNIIKKCESEVVCTSTTGTMSAIKTQLYNTCTLAVTTQDESEQRDSKVAATSFVHTSSHKVWPSHWHSCPSYSVAGSGGGGSDDGVGGDGDGGSGVGGGMEVEGNISANGLLGTSSPHSWHTATEQPQLITEVAESVCCEPAECYELVGSAGGCSEQQQGQSSLEKPECNVTDNTELEVSAVKYPQVKSVKMRDECEPTMPSFTRRRRYKVREGQTMSGNVSTSHGEQSVCDKLSESPAVNNSDQSSEPSSPSSFRNGDSSEPSSPLHNNTVMPSEWLPAPPEAASEAQVNDFIATIPPPDDYVESQEEDEPIIIEGKFKNICKYKETVRLLADADEDAYDPSITTIIQLDENDQSEPEDDISNHEEMSQQELDTHLSRLEVSAPDMNVQAPSDSSRDSSNEPEQEDIRLRIKRSSSLKCGKTPPGTPGIGNTKKIVRFADSLGLDLADVRTFLEGIPNVPKSAFGDLEMQNSDEDVEHQCSPATSNSSVKPTHAVLNKRMLMPLFQQPFALPGFMDRVRDQKVVLENVSVGEDMSVRGYVRVLNLDFHKFVMVRYTFDGWRNFHEANATYVSGSCDGFSDRFSFLLWGSFLQENGSLSFCIKYNSGGGEYWDNNRGTNYALQCYCNQPVKSHPPLHQQALHHGSHDLFNPHKSVFSRHFGGLQNSPPTPSSESWTTHPAFF